MIMNNSLAELVAREACQADAVEAALVRLYAGESLTQAGAESLFIELVEGRLSEPAIAAMLVALRLTGETTDALIGAARALRAFDAPFARPDYLFADTCGTGGDRMRAVSGKSVSVSVVRGGRSVIKKKISITTSP